MPIFLIEPKFLWEEGLCLFCSLLNSPTQHLVQRRYKDLASFQPTSATIPLAYEFSSHFLSLPNSSPHFLLASPSSAFSSHLIFKFPGPHTPLLVTYPARSVGTLRRFTHLLLFKELVEAAQAKRSKRAGNICAFAYPQSANTVRTYVTFGS